MSYLAVDIGGTQIRVAHFTGFGEMQHRISVKTEAHLGLSAVLARIESAIRTVWSKSGSPAAMGVGVPGLIAYESGVVRFAVNLPGWLNVPLRDHLTEIFRVPVFVANDAAAATLGEYRFGAGRGATHMVLLTVGTGIGGGIILDGQLVTGGQGMAGEVGHMSVAREGPRCACGNVGCLEMAASGTAIAKAAQARLRAGGASLLATRFAGVWERIAAADVSDAASSGDVLAREILADAGVALAIGIINLMVLLNPEIIVLGGSVMQAGDWLWEPLLATVADRAPLPYRAATRIVRASLGDDAGLYGALSLALPDR
ncbi:MAG: ROK family protein [Anaerolineae bacterium]|nr:ROK family protein [Anaerolineae bacterium]